MWEAALSCISIKLRLWASDRTNMKSTWTRKYIFPDLETGACATAMGLFSNNPSSISCDRCLRWKLWKTISWLCGSWLGEMLPHLKMCRTVPILVDPPGGLWGGQWMLKNAKWLKYGTLLDGKLYTWLVVVIVLYSSSIEVLFRESQWDGWLMCFDREVSTFSDMVSCTLPVAYSPPSVEVAPRRSFWSQPTVTGYKVWVYSPKNLNPFATAILHINPGILVLSPSSHIQHCPALPAIDSGRESTLCPKSRSSTLVGENEETRGERKSRRSNPIYTITPPGSPTNFLPFYSINM